MLRVSVFLVLLPLAAPVLFAGPAVSFASESYDCPAYVAELRVAKTSLLRRDRTGAVAALRRAQEALAECIRESSEETALAASMVWSPCDGDAS
jgi:hypothetical protein